MKAGPGVFAAARFVATRVVQGAAARERAGCSATRRAGSYLAVAWVLPGKQAEWDAWVGARDGDDRRARAGCSPGRDHVHTAIYACIWHAGAVDAIVALDRGFAGAVVVADERRRARTSTCPATVGLRLERTILSRGRPAAARARRSASATTIRVATFAALAPTLDRCGFASPFLATIPGTDTYADDL